MSRGLGPLPQTAWTAPGGTATPREQARRDADGIRANFQTYGDMRGKSISAQADAWAAPEATDFENTPKPPSSFGAGSTRQDGEDVFPQISGRTIRGAPWIVFLASAEGER